MKQDVILGLTPSGIIDTGAMSTCGRLFDMFIWTGKLSNKQFQVPTGQDQLASERAKLLHDIQEPARTVDIVLT